MSIATVVTHGFGSFGSVNFLPTLGYSSGAVDEAGPSIDYTGIERRAEYTSRSRRPEFTVTGQRPEFTLKKT